MGYSDDIKDPIVPSPSGTPPDVADVFNRIVGGIGVLVAMGFVGLLIYGGYKYMISQGDSNKVKEAEALIRNAVIGLLIILGAYLIKEVVWRILGLSSGKGGS